MVALVKNQNTAANSSILPSFVNNPAPMKNNLLPSQNSFLYFPKSSISLLSASVSILALRKSPDREESNNSTRIMDEAVVARKDDLVLLMILSRASRISVARWHWSMDLSSSSVACRRCLRCSCSVVTSGRSWRQSFLRGAGLK